MDIIETTYAGVTELVAGILRDQREACVYCVADEPCAIVGSNGGADLEAATRKGVRVVQIRHEGGTIVSAPGDVEIGIFSRGMHGRLLRDEIIRRIMDKLTAAGQDAAIDGNDILVQGKKVCGFGSRLFGEVLYCAVQVSVNVNLDMIREICTKPMKKEPAGLAAYGIHTEDILEILRDVMKQEE